MAPWKRDTKLAINVRDLPRELPNAIKSRLVKANKTIMRMTTKDPSLAIMPQMMKNMVAKLSLMRMYSNI
jgi:hypothetical protein